MNKTLGFRVHMGLVQLGQEIKEREEAEMFLREVEDRIDRQTSSEVHDYISGVYEDELKRNAGSLLCSYAFGLLNT